MNLSEAVRYEPTVAERRWYRHSETGDRGYYVRRESRDAIRYDRPATDDYSFDLAKWKIEAVDAPRFTIIQIAQVCFEADKKLCWAMGRQDLARREWLDMTEGARKKWLEDGPTDSTRKAVYEAIKRALA
jgi:hypothetical protein